MDTSWSEIQVKTLLNLLAPHPCLYDTYFAVYFTFEERHRMYEQICEKLRFVMPVVTVNQIKTKMKSLRRQFNQEMKLVQEARERGKEYKPNLWCYDHLKFLQGRSEGSSHSAEAVIVITDSDGQTDAVANNHAQGNPKKKVKCGKDITHMKHSSIKKTYPQEGKHYMDAKRKRKIPKNHGKYILECNSNKKSVINESVHDDNYEGDIEDATVRSEKMPRPNALFLVQYFQSLFSDGLHNSNNEYLLNNTAGYSYCFGAKHDAVTSGVSQVIENDHISCHTYGDEEIFNEKADYEELSDEKVQFLAYFIEQANSNLDFEYHRGEYYMIDTSKHIIHSQGKKMETRNRENRQVNFYHKYQYMNLSLPILKSARYVRLCPETIEDDSYLHGAETNGENLQTLSPFRTSGRSIRDILNASEQLESLDTLNKNFCSVTESMMQNSHQETNMMKSVQAEGSYIVNYLTHHENGAVVHSPNRNNYDSTLNKNIENDIDKFSMLSNYVLYDTDSATSNDDFKGSVQANMIECKTLESDSDQESMRMKNSSGMNQQIARDQYFFKKESEHVMLDNWVGPSNLNDQHKNIPTAPNWLQEKPHCSKSEINHLNSYGPLGNRSSSEICSRYKNLNYSNEENGSSKSIDKTLAGNVDSNAHVGTAQKHVDSVREPMLDKTCSPPIVLGSSHAGKSYAHAHALFVQKILDNNVANQIQNQEVEDGNNNSDCEDDVYYLDVNDDDDQSELTFDGYFNNSFLLQSENSSWHQSSKDSGNGGDSSCSVSSDEGDFQLGL